MIIINGAGSQLAKNYIADNQKHEILAISRSSNFNHKNVKSVNLNSNTDLEKILLDTDKKNLIWINFQTIKFDELILNTTLDKLKKSFEINFFKNYIAVKTLLPKMIKNHYGKFIFVDSVKARMGDVGCLAYASSKSANRPLMQSVVNEFSRFNITCNTISIGLADTPMFNDIPENKRKELIKNVPGKKLIDNQDLNSAVRFILENDSVNGLTINLDGGMLNSG